MLRSGAQTDGLPNRARSATVWRLIPHRPRTVTTIILPRQTAVRRPCSQLLQVNGRRRQNAWQGGTHHGAREISVLTPPAFIGNASLRAVAGASARRFSPSSRWTAISPAAAVLPYNIAFTQARTARRYALRRLRRPRRALFLVPARAQYSELWKTTPLRVAPAEAAGSLPFLLPLRRRQVWIMQRRTRRTHRYYEQHWWVHLLLTKSVAGRCRLVLSSRCLQRLRAAQKTQGRDSVATCSPAIAPRADGLFRRNTTALLAATTRRIEWRG